MKNFKIKLGHVVLALALVFVASASKASAAADFTGCPTLMMGSTATSCVMTLQTGVGVTADGKFGPMTKAAVMAFQTAHALTADGIAGAMTKAAITGSPVVVTGLPAGCTSTTGFSTTTGASCATSSTLPAGCTVGALFSSTTGMSCTSTTGGSLNGTAGTISDLNTLSQYNNTEVSGGQSDVKIYGADVKASKDGDISLYSTKVSFALTNGSGSVKLADYVSSVGVWVGSTKVGSANAADFTKDSTGNYSKTIVLSSAIVRSNTTEKMYVSVTPLSNLDSGDIDSETVTFGLDNIRYTDGGGVVTTEDSTGDLPVSGFSVKFVDFATSADTELKISTNSTPSSTVVKVSTTNDTKGVTLLNGKMKLDGTSSVWLDEVPVTFTTSGDSLDALTGTVYLTIGGNTYSESTGANCTPTCASNTTAVVTFDNLDLTLAAGSTTTYSVSVDLNDLENTGVTATDFDEGDTLLASLTTTNRGNIVAENSEGDQLQDSTEMTGSSIGEAMTFRSVGIALSLVGTPTAAVAKGLTTAPDLGTYTITFDVTAFGGDMYIDGTKPTLTGTASTDLDIIPGTGGTGTQDATITSSNATRSGTINADARFLVPEGETKRFTITSVVTPTVAGGIYSVALAALRYDTTDVTGTLNYTTDLSDFVTPGVNLVLVN